MFCLVLVTTQRIEGVTNLQLMRIAHIGTRWKKSKYDIYHTIEDIDCNP